jgi:micrococcal nuclease
MKKIKIFLIRSRFFIFFAVFALLIGSLIYQKLKNPPATSILKDQAKVSQVTDGDTIILADGKKIRLIGIDAPEINFQIEESECFATQAANLLKELIEGQIVSLEKDKENMDRYGRYLRYVYSDNVFINEFILRQGYAKAILIHPNAKYWKEFEAAEKEAKEAKRGLWGKCNY